MSFYLIVWAIILSAASGLAGLFFKRRGRAARSGQIACVLILVVACTAGLVGSVRGLFEPASVSYLLPWPSAGEPLLGLDPLSAFFLVLVFFVASLCSIYALGYTPAERNPRTSRRTQLFFGLLVAGMALLLIARHALAFLVGWEAMALSAYFLIVSEDGLRENRRAGFVYLVATHYGTLALFGMFALWHAATGSFELSPAASMDGGALCGIVLLALFGFGVKAGMMPLHFWLPGAHAAAPSHVSALLSGVMLKMGIYGIVRMLSLLPVLSAFWGVLVLCLGAVSGLLGVAYALAQHDLKRLLAYHSVENIGIILMGLGLALLGRAWGRPEIVALAMGGCLLHVWNHGLFKSLLFLGAGSVLRATGTRRIDKLGGLIKSMPWTAGFFIVGAVAICGLPPLNGFVSELLIYLGIFGGLSQAGTGEALTALAAPCLAMIGALAVACFVKATGATFLGSPRAPEAECGREASASMLIPMGILAASCVAIGLASGLVAPILDAAVGSWNTGETIALPGIATLAPLDYISYAGIGLVAAVALVSLILAIRFARWGSKTNSSRERTAGLNDSCRSAPTWDCGYAAPTGRMQYTASSFARGLVLMFAWALKPSPEPAKLRGVYPARLELETEVEDGVLGRIIAPGSRLLARLSQRVRRFQQGLTQQYVLYILIALAVLLLTLIPAGGVRAIP
jgi:hydrogenase-4 component B